MTFREVSVFFQNLHPKMQKAQKAKGFELLKTIASHEVFSVNIVRTKVLQEFCNIFLLRLIAFGNQFVITFQEGILDFLVIRIKSLPSLRRELA